MARPAAELETQERRQKIKEISKQIAVFFRKTPEGDVNYFIDHLEGYGSIPMEINRALLNDLCFETNSFLLKTLEVLNSDTPEIKALAIQLLLDLRAGVRRVAPPTQRSR